MLQGMDFLELYRRYGCTLQTGGSDQWGNLTAGIDLIRRVEGASVHALATPLITKADGTKFGKTEGGAIWLDPELTTPYAFYQFWLNADDRDVATLPADLQLPDPRGDRGAGAADGRAAAGPRGPAGAGRGVDHPGARRRPVRGRGRRVQGAVRPGRPHRARRAHPRAALAELPHATGQRTGTGRRPVGRHRAWPPAVRGPPHHQGGRRVPQQRQGRGRGRRADTKDLMHGRWLVLRRGKRNLGAVELA